MTMQSSLGMGITLVGRDQASPVIGTVKKGLADLRNEANRTGAAMGKFAGDVPVKA